MTDTLDRDDIVRTLEREQGEARAQAEARRRARDTQAENGTPATGRTHRDFRQAEHYQHAYLAIGPAQGSLLYMLARAAGARRIVEFGSSFGISTLYLAAAAEDNDGQVIGSEYYANKREHALASLHDAGLSQRAEIRLGDARDTLADIEGPVDFVFLDGDKSLYLPVLEGLVNQLTSGAWVVADNLDHFDETPGDFRHEIVRDARFTTRLMPIGRGMFSVSRYRG
ncbi:O-methyltransferase [Aidingimonas lacisalsi]|uniref:O-methyltransferase n=1 Tax=Aidingimonas lacisalsi TaxID=2604086 RepID=UPI0011D2440C|nr:class I SAM-dependent methyltransferase [Aidingimonas lacisalsi]